MQNIIIEWMRIMVKSKERAWNTYNKKLDLQAQASQSFHSSCKSSMQELGQKLCNLGFSHQFMSIPPVMGPWLSTGNTPPE